MSVTTVVLLSDAPGSRLGEALELLPGGRFVLSYGAAGELRGGETVAVLDDRLTSPPKGVALPEGCPAILPSRNRAAVGYARGAGLVPLDCGLSLRDTLTLSSRTDSSVVISLQRSVARLDGGVVDPVEVPLKLCRKWAPYPLLCCAGVLLLTGGAADLLGAGFF